MAGPASKSPGRAFLSGVMRPEHCWGTTFVYSVVSSHSTMTVSSANLLEIKCWKNVKTILCCRRLLRKKVYSFVESKRKSSLTAFDYLETDYPRGKLKRKTMSPLQESPECNRTTAMAGLRAWLLPICPSRVSAMSLKLGRKCALSDSENINDWTRKSRPFSFGKWTQDETEELHLPVFSAPYSTEWNPRSQKWKRVSNAPPPALTPCPLFRTLWKCIPHVAIGLATTFTAPCSLGNDFPFNLRRNLFISQPLS